LLAIDMVSTEVDLLHNKSSRIKTLMGSLFTLIITIFFIYSIVYFGSDLIFKVKPITRFSKEFTNTSRIYIKDYPIKIAITDPLGNLLPHETYIQFQSTFMKLGIDEDFISYGSLIIERCKDEFIPTDQISHVKSSGDYYFNNSLCVNPFKYFSRNGTLMEEDVYIQNTFGTTGSAYIIINLFPCTNSTENASSCLPMDDQVDLVKQTMVTINFMDSYIDLTDYEIPSHYLSSLVSTQLTSEDTKKAHSITVKETKIRTDSGIIMESMRNSSIYQVDSIKSDIFNGDNYYKFQIDGSNINDVNFRRYVKVQDIIASIGGLIKFLLTIATLFVEFFSNLGMRLDIINSLFYIKEPSDKRRESSSMNHLQNNDVNIIGFNKMGNRVILKENRVINSSIRDYLKNVFRCRSRYPINLYYQFNDIIYQKLEITNIIKDSLILEKLTTLVLSEDEYKKVMQKQPISGMSKIKSIGLRKFAKKAQTCKLNNEY
jgi:hypothetical protein